MENAEKIASTSSTPPTHTHTDVILIVSTSSHLGLGCEVPSSRSREEAFASFCSPLVLEVVGLVLLKKYIRYKPKYEQEKHNEDFGNSSITTRNGTSTHSYCTMIHTSFLLSAPCLFFLRILFAPFVFFVLPLWGLFPGRHLHYPKIKGGPALDGYNEGSNESKRSREDKSRHNINNKPLQEMDGVCIKVCWLSSNIPNTSNKETNTQRICNWIKTIQKNKSLPLLHLQNNQMPNDVFSLFQPLPTWGLAVKFLHRGLGKKPLHLSALHLSWRLWD